MRIKLRSYNKMKRVMGILPMKHGQDGHATTNKIILLEVLIFRERNNG